MSVPGLKKIRVGILVLSILSLLCISSVAAINSNAFIEKLPIAQVETMEQVLPIFHNIEKWDAVQGLTAIAILSILYSGFLAWQGFKKIGELEKTNREMILKLGNRKCLLDEKEYMQAFNEAIGKK